jgi:hypothetical protein
LPAAQKRQSRRSESQRKVEITVAAIVAGQGFRVGKDLSLVSISARRVGGTSERGNSNADKRIHVKTEYVVVRRPPTPELAYTADDIDPTDSPWLRECGMVRVKSDDAGGCHIIPKSSIQKSD